MLTHSLKLSGMTVRLQTCNFECDNTHFVEMSVAYDMYKFKEIGGLRTL